MRWTVRYGHCLTVGAEVIGLYLSALFLVRIGHPPWFLPWSEVSVWKRRKFLWFRYVELRLGRDAQLPFMIDSQLAGRIREAAGTNWPIEPVS
jgi:hypothetical protein